MFTDKDFREQFQKDLNEKDDSKRVLKSIGVISADEMFDILNLPNPQCDADGNYIIEGDELKCLNYIWMAYIPK